MTPLDRTVEEKRQIAIEKKMRDLAGKVITLCRTQSIYVYYDVLENKISRCRKAERLPKCNEIELGVDKLSEDEPDWTQEDIFDFFMQQIYDKYNHILEESKEKLPLANFIEKTIDIFIPSSFYNNLFSHINEDTYNQCLKDLINANNKELNKKICSKINKYKERMWKRKDLNDTEKLKQQIRMDDITYQLSK